MEIESIADIRLVMRAVMAGWVSDEKMQIVVNSMVKLAAQGLDENVRVKAADAVTKIAEADLKRQLIEEQKKRAEFEQRIRILEQLGKLDPTELATRARAIGYRDGNDEPVQNAGGRAGEASRVDGGEASEGSRSVHPDTGGPDPAK